VHVCTPTSESDMGMPHRVETVSTRKGMGSGVPDCRGDNGAAKKLKHLPPRGAARVASLPGQFAWAKRNRSYNCSRSEEVGDVRCGSAHQPRENRSVSRSERWKTCAAGSAHLAAEPTMLTAKRDKSLKPVAAPPAVKAPLLSLEDAETEGEIEVDICVIGGGIAFQSAVRAAAKSGKHSVAACIGNPFVEFGHAAPIFIADPTQHRRFLCGEPSAFVVKGVHVRYIADAVTRVDPEAQVVSFANRKGTLKYRALIVATGRRLPLLSPRPGDSLLDRLEEIRNAGRTLARAKKVLLVGGGLIGVEVATAIAYARSSRCRAPPAARRATCVCAHTRLCAARGIALAHVVHACVHTLESPRLTHAATDRRTRSQMAATVKLRHPSIEHVYLLCKSGSPLSDTHPPSTQAYVADVLTRFGVRTTIHGCMCRTPAHRIPCSVHRRLMAGSARDVCVCAAGAHTAWRARSQRGAARRARSYCTAARRRDGTRSTAHTVPMSP
jgi:hypothetical protein